MYSEKIMNEFLNPQNYGVIKGASGVGKVSSDVGSEIIKYFIKVEDGRIVDCQFQAFGGVVAIALASIGTTLMMGRTILGAKRIQADDILEADGGEVPENKTYLLNIIKATMLKTLENYEEKNEVVETEED